MIGPWILPPAIYDHLEKTGALRKEGESIFLGSESVARDNYEQAATPETVEIDYLAMLPPAEWTEEFVAMVGRFALDNREDLAPSGGALVIPLPSFVPFERIRQLADMSVYVRTYECEVPKNADLMGLVWLKKILRNQFSTNFWAALSNKATYNEGPHA